MNNQYTCALCGKVFKSTRSVEDAEKEAEIDWGVKDAASNPDMSVICGSCYISKVEPFLQKMRTSNVPM